MSLIGLPIRTTQASEACCVARELCDKALKARDKENADLHLGVDLLKSQNNDLNNQVTALENKSRAFYRNPWFLVALGVAAGAFVARH